MKRPDLCDYCGERLATEQIDNPNGTFIDGDKPFWEVCGLCKRVIKAQQKLSMGQIFDQIQSTEQSQKMIKEAREELNKIAQQTGETIMTVSLTKK